jgi:hypothetical protein
MKERGMMKWAPYKSLSEQGTYLAKMEAKKREIAQPRLTSDKAEELDSLLRNYGKQEVIVTYFAEASLHQETGRIAKIDIFYKYLEINGTIVPFASLVDIEES